MTISSHIEKMLWAALIAFAVCVAVWLMLPSDQVMPRSSGTLQDAYSGGAGDASECVSVTVDSEGKILTRLCSRDIESKVKEPE